MIYKIIVFVAITIAISSVKGNCPETKGTKLIPKGDIDFRFIQ